MNSPRKKEKRKKKLPMAAEGGRNLGKNSRKGALKEKAVYQKRVRQS